MFDMFDRMDVDDPSWVPTIPTAYSITPVAQLTTLPAFTFFPRPSPCVLAPTPIATPPATPAPITAAHAETVNFPIDPAITNEFGERIAKSSIGSSIGRVGDLPMVVCDGRSMQMCGCIHLTGTCKKTCQRIADHIAHSPDEVGTLLGCCRVAYA
jgi:hypothetical protein